MFGFHSTIPGNSPHTLPSSIHALTFQEIPRILSLTQCVLPVQIEGISQESVEQKHKQTPVPWLGLWSGMPNTSPCSLSLISPAPWVTAGGHSFESYAGPPMIYHPLTVFVLKIPSWEFRSPSPHHKVLPKSIKTQTGKHTVHVEAEWNLFKKTICYPQAPLANN